MDMCLAKERVNEVVTPGGLTNHESHDSKHALVFVGPADAHSPKGGYYEHASLSLVVPVAGRQAASSSKQLWRKNEKSNLPLHLGRRTDPHHLCDCNRRYGCQQAERDTAPPRGTQSTTVRPVP